MSIPFNKFTRFGIQSSLITFGMNAGIWAILIFYVLFNASPVKQVRGTSPPNACSCRKDIPSGCTVFTVSKGDQVFFGGNDDYINLDSYYWVDPGGARGYGAIWIGTPDNVQQGVNEKGLAYDANGLPRVDVHSHPERLPVSGGYTSYPIHILRECATVEEVITWVNKHQWHTFMHDQMQFADASGDAVVISAGPDGELVFTRKPRGDSYLVSTNFNVANPANGFGIDSRYGTAQKLLEGLVRREGNLTAQDAADVLDAVHQSGVSSWTRESLVADLPSGIVYLYYFYQFDKPVVLNVAEEIASARPGGSLSKLFPEDVQEEAARRYQRIQEGDSLCQVLGKVWLGLVLVSLVAFRVLSAWNRQAMVFWMTVVIILGPFGLLTWLVAGRKPGTSTWRSVLVEATGDVSPTVVAFVIYLVVVILIPAVQASQPLQVLLIFGLPLLFGLFVFQGPLLARGTQKDYLRTLLQRLPQAWVVANLGMAGINLLAAPFVNMSLRTCSFFPDPPPLGMVSLWTFAVMGALVALLLLMLYEGWAVRRGFQAWSALASGDGEIISPSWRKLWWWILLSYAALFAGVAASQMIQGA